MNLSGLEKQIGKIERVAGIGPCVACEQAAELERESEELRVALGLPDLPEDTPRVELTATCCGRIMLVALFAFTPEEVAAFERWEAMFRAGEICRPEFDRLYSVIDAALDRSMAERYGEHEAEFRRLYEAHRARRDESREPSIPYFCRVPGCACHNQKRPPLQVSE